MNILIAVIVLIVALSFILVFANTHPPRYPLQVPPSKFLAPFEEVSFTARDGTRLSGWLIGEVRPGVAVPAIIICHGLGANRSDFTELAVLLSRRGYLVLAFDFRGHGDSSGCRTSLGLREQDDLATALAFLLARKEIDRSRIGVYGFSMGASVALMTAAHEKRIAAVVADSAFATLAGMARTAVTGFYHLPAFPFVPLTKLGYLLLFQAGVDRVAPAEVVGSIAPRPLLLIAGEGDQLVPGENGRLLFDAANEPKELWTIRNAPHGATLAAAGSEYEARVGAFFDRHLRPGQQGAGRKERLN